MPVVSRSPISWVNPLLAVSLVVLMLAGFLAASGKSPTIAVHHPLTSLVLSGTPIHWRREHNSSPATTQAK